MKSRPVWSLVPCEALRRVSNLGSSMRLGNVQNPLFLPESSFSAASAASALAWSRQNGSRPKLTLLTSQAMAMGSLSLSLELLLSYQRKVSSFLSLGTVLLLRQRLLLWWLRSLRKRWFCAVGLLRSWRWALPRIWVRVRVLAWVVVRALSSRIRRRRTFLVGIIGLWLLQDRSPRWSSVLPSFYLGCLGGISSASWVRICRGMA